MLSLRVDPRPIAVARIGLGAAALINTLELYVVLNGLAEGKLSMPFIGWAPQVTANAALTFLIIGATAAICLILGILASIAAGVYAVAAATVLLWDQQTYSSHQVLVVLLVTYLVFAEADTAWSVVRRPGARADVPWWPQLLLMTQLSVCYLFAGLSKVNPEFLTGRPLSDWVRWPMPEWVYLPMAIATITTEVAVLAIGLWLPRVRVVAVAAGVCLHVCIIAMLGDMTVQLVAFAMACVSLYPLFLARPSGTKPSPNARPKIAPMPDIRSTNRSAL